MTASRSPRPDPTTTEETPEPTSSGQSSRGRKPASNGRRRSTPPRVQAKAATDTPGTAQEVAGIVGDASAQVSRSGEDVRKRGWFWHWNSIVTQYAPLLGLKGVGLLNSYTVWTDRREESPHRGYAFPSQQSEADFYGEDRAELITINKILVALDLIEIRKEMVLRVDAQGRRWKVPHNLYRVKDHGDDVTLTTRDVMRVIELADRDRAVYRYLRRVFSPRFSPIDHANVWHQILEEVRPTPVWQRLAARTEKEERKASERTKAGHASRKENATPVTESEVSEAGTGAFSLPTRGDNAAFEATGVASNASTNNDSGADETDGEIEFKEIFVASINRGSGTDQGTVVASTNSGLDRNRAGTVGHGNRGRRTIVAPSNTTYHQPKTTTTTVDDDDEIGSGRGERLEPASRFGTNQGPDASRDEAIALQRFAEANDRQPTAAERRHLRQIAEFASPIVEPGSASPWHLVSSAIEEAVSAGSSYVAPKRIREILTRWTRDGVPAEYAGNVPGQAVGDSVSNVSPWAVTSGSPVGHNGDANASGRPAMGDGIVLPNGRSAQAIWESVGRDVSGALGSAVAESLLAGTSIAAYDAGEVTIRVRDAAQHEAMLGEHAMLIGRALRAQLRRPVRLATVLAESDAPDTIVEVEPLAVSTGEAAPRAKRARLARPEPVTLGAIPVFTVERCGLTNRQLWAMALNDLREQGVIPGADIDAWLHDAAVLSLDDRDDAVSILLGVPHVLAQRRVEARFRSAIAGTLAMLLGDESLAVSLDVTIIRDWHARQSA
ncbi:MAG: hypothetical protein QM753_02795 [Thermomicrobiales bacterium]